MNWFQWMWRRMSNRKTAVPLLAALGIGVTAVSIARRRKLLAANMWQRMMRPVQRAFR